MKKALGAVGVIAALAFSTIIASPAMAAVGSQSPVVTENGIDTLITDGWIKSVDGDFYVDGASIAPVAASLDTYTAETPGYDRKGMFGAAWVTKIDGCDTRNRILQRDFATFETREDGCTVVTGVFDDPYSGETMGFQRTNYPTTGEGNSSAVQIDHIIPLKAAWNGGADSWTQAERIAFANDPVNLWASKGSLNASKGDRLYNTWTPPNAEFTCQYVAQMVWLLDEHDIAVTASDKSAMQATLASADCELPTTSDTGDLTFSVPTSVGSVALSTGITVPYSGYPANSNLSLTLFQGSNLIEQRSFTSDETGAGTVTVSAMHNGAPFPAGTSFTLGLNVTGGGGYGATFTTTDDGIPDPVELIVVTPVAPTVTPAEQCGEPGIVVYPIVPGVEYSGVGGDRGSAIIAAHPEVGYTFPEGATTSWTLTTIEECDHDTPTFVVPTTVTPSDLAGGIEIPFTGFPAGEDIRFVFSLADGTVLSDETVAADEMGNGILSVRATLNGTSVPNGTEFTLTYYLNGEPVTQAFTATTETTPPVTTETPDTDTPDADSPVTGVPTGEIAYTGGALAPALWIGGGVLLALLGGVAIFLIRRRADLNSVVESSEDTTETPAEEQ